MAPRVELFACYRDPISGKWIRARYVATREEIEQRYAEWEILGPAEVRNVGVESRYFTAHASSTVAEQSNEYSESAPELLAPNLHQYAGAAALALDRAANWEKMP